MPHPAVRYGLEFFGGILQKGYMLEILTLLNEKYKP